MDIIIQRLKHEADDGNQLYIQRDDLLPFSMGGNKVRIANAFFQDMKEKKCDSMIIYGSRHSNLCRVLANLCCSHGVECHMICSHSGEEDSAPTANTHLIDWANVNIIHCRTGEIAATVEQVMDEIRSRGKKPYYIYGDKFGKGNEGTAASAYAEVYPQIREYERRQGWEFDCIFCPCGTGATHSGLVCGHLLAGDSKKIFGILISSRETERAYQVAEDGICDYFAGIGKELPENFRDEIMILDAYRMGGYGQYDERIKECIREEYRRNSIPLDPIYTAKAFYGMKEYMREQGIKDSRILFLHTGGTPLFYDFLLQDGGKTC